ncbi:MAG: GntR family transcriptional regulator [Firmicutes bacterium]|nr:GntR family transcriptional regulator [Bacillota bacterium]
MNKSIDKSSSTPLYIQLAEIIEGGIYEGQHPQGSKLPSEQELMETYNVSRVTVRQTMKHLAAKNIIIRRQGIGTFVNKQIFSQTVSDIMGFYPSLLSKANNPEMKILLYETIDPDSDVQEKLQLPSEAKVLHYTRQYLVENSILVVTQVYIPIFIAEKWTRDDAEKNASHRLIQEKAGFTINNSSLKIRASLASKQVADYLNTAKGSPVLELRRLTYSIEQQPIEYAIFSFRGDSYELTTKIIGSEKNSWELKKQ